ncbi:MAG: hypothetical protein JEZ11_01420 [Desulfobacterales bacterium]|nr:hypothetical protein [Desulfobacterales bacterium]
MEKFKILFLSICVVIFHMTNINMAIGNGLSDAKVTIRETYGLNTVKEDGGYRVKTFIPRGFLLFNIDENEPFLKVGQEYLSATTQDGVRLFIHKSAVSGSSFKDLYGTQSVIFNKTHSICLKEQCDPTNDDQLLEIGAGEVFEKIEISEGTLKLVGNRGSKTSPEIVEGFIGKDKLESLNTQAIVTFATLKHPRYTLSTSEATNLGSSCGEIITKGDQRVFQSLSKTDKKIIDAFAIAKTSNNDQLITFKKEFGGKNKEVVFKKYDVTDQRFQPHKTVSYVAQIIYHCDSTSILSKRTYIESVAIVNLHTGKSKSFTPLGTPDDLYDCIGAPYMYSVNSTRQYFLLMNKLSEHFESRALAGFFLSEFNRSCKGKFRKTKAKCQHLSYENN